MAMNAAQHKIINLLKAFFCSAVSVNVCVFNVWPRQLFFFQCGPGMPKFWTPLDREGRQGRKSPLLAQSFHFAPFNQAPSASGDPTLATLKLGDLLLLQEEF